MDFLFNVLNTVDLHTLSQKITEALYYLGNNDYSQEAIKSFSNIIDHFRVVKEGKMTAIL
jgi:hypothetical protein